MEMLTNSQKSIWVIEQYYKGCSINNICGLAIIEEPIDILKLKQAVEIVCKKHDNFSLQLEIEKGEIKQIVSEKKELPIYTICVANSDELEKETEKIVRTPFNLENSELYKFYIFKFENGEGGCMLNIHHLIADAWTLAFICNEIIQIYSNLKQNKEIEKDAIYSYAEYIKSEQEYLKSEKYQKDKLYWEEKFSQIPEIATIPGSKKNVDENNPIGERQQFNLDTTKVEKIKQYCKENKISLYNFFMAIYGIYIGEISNLDEFVIGTPILNRTNFKEKNATGMFVNMIPFKINMNQSESFKTFIKRIALDSMGMLKHQKYSYQCLLENLRKNNKNIPNLYNILLSYQITNAHQRGGDMSYRAKWTFNGCCAENMDIQIFDINDTGSLNIAYDYKTSIYEKQDIEKLHKRVLNIIDQIVAQSDIDIKDIDIVTPEEKEILITEFNKTEKQYNPNIPIIKYFEEQAQKTPNNIAMVFEDKSMTYKELNEKANSLAHELRKNAVANNTIVGIMQERSFEMIIAILAVLKSGGSYIPIAPDYPIDRIQYMLEDSNASILLAETSKVKTDKKIISIKLDNKMYEENKDNLENISQPDDLAYLIYTSGSTGTPKGVMLKQKNLTNFYNAMLQQIEYLTAKDPIKIISITTLSFDIFIFETLISLTRGLILYMTNEKEQKITELLETKIKDNEIQAIQTTPSVIKFHLNNIQNKENLKSLKYIILAGEPLPKTLVDQIKEMIPGAIIYNGYGPSETTIFSTTKNVTNLKEITIGKPIANTQIYILNKNKKILPQGSIGEMYISGDGVGKGYMNKKEQTETNFIINPFLENHIMYKTGDLGAFDEDGEIKCYGRIDNQIKLNGLRIELGEIEENINKFKKDHLLKSAVILKEVDNKKTLNAFISYPSKINKEELKKYLLEKMPSYMQPNTITWIPKLPFTPNGKIDKKALKNYEIDADSANVEYVPPRNETEKILIDVIKKKLKLKNFGIDNNIFDFGADSLTIINIITELFRYNYNLKVIDIYKHPTVREICEEVLGNKENKDEEFDFSNFDSLNLKVKNFSKRTDCKKIENKYNILLTGATGFFGSHLLIELLNKTNQIGKIYCAVRAKKNISAKERLLKKVNFYFGDIYNELFDKYVEVVECEISEKQFGLDEEKYNELKNNVDIVIHSAANVKHYGKYANFENDNILVTKNIIEFCKNSNVQLDYISTMTVCGNYLIKQNTDMNKFDENSLYIGQNFEENVYSKSKLIAESMIIKNMNEEFNATIYRLGDLTGRYTDGKFQENINENATYLRLKSILEIGAIPETIVEKKLEFSPVDYVAKAVTTIIWSDQCKNRIFNVYNPNMITTYQLLNFIEKINYSVKAISKEAFANIIEKMSSDEEMQKKLIGIINDFTDNKDLVYNYTIEQNNEITTKYLETLKFNWCQVNEKYIDKLVEYMKQVKFIN